MIRNSDMDHFLARASLIANPFYREFPPAPDLEEFVACTWVRVVQCAGAVLNDAILPDGCADIMVYGEQPPRVAGPDAFTRRTTLWDGLVIAGIRLRPGACRAVLGCSATEIVNGGALLSDIAASGHRLHRTLTATGNLSARLALLEEWVRAALDTTTNNDKAVIAAWSDVGRKFRARHRCCRPSLRLEHAHDSPAVRGRVRLQSQTFPTHHAHSADPAACKYPDTASACGSRCCRRIRRPVAHDARFQGDHGVQTEYLFR